MSLENNSTRFSYVTVLAKVFHLSPSSPAIWIPNHLKEQRKWRVRVL
jgi:hypothetical protein